MYNCVLLLTFVREALDVLLVKASNFKIQDPLYEIESETKHMYTYMHKRERQTDRQTDRPSGRQTDLQAGKDRETERVSESEKDRLTD